MARSADRYGALAWGRRHLAWGFLLSMVGFVAMDCR